jgi:hypothetical protein
MVVMAMEVAQEVIPSRGNADRLVLLLPGSVVEMTVGAPMDMRPMVVLHLHGPEVDEVVTATATVSKVDTALPPDLQAAPRLGRLHHPLLEALQHTVAMVATLVEAMAIPTEDIPPSLAWVLLPDLLLVALALRLDWVLCFSTMEMELWELLRPHLQGMLHLQ